MAVSTLVVGPAIAESVARFFADTGNVSEVERLRELGVPVEKSIPEVEQEIRVIEESAPEVIDKVSLDPEGESDEEISQERESLEEDTSIMAVTPPYRYAQDFDL